MPISYRQAIKLLREAGFEQVKARTGRHEIWKHPLGPRVSLGFHGGYEALRRNEVRELEAGVAEVRRLTEEMEP